MVEQTEDKQKAANQVEQTTTKDDLNDQVIACIDGSDGTGAVVDYSCWIAQKSDSPLTLLHTIENHQAPAVVDLSGAIGLGSRQELLNELTELEQSRSRLLIQQGQMILQQAKQQANQSGMMTAQLAQRHGSLLEALIDLEQQTGIVVIGVRGEAHQPNSSGTGAQLEPVIRAMHTPILVVTQKYTEPKKIMLAYDGSEACNKALEMVATSSLSEGLCCHLVHVGDKAEAMLAEAEGHLKKAGIEVVSCQLVGKAEQVLAQYQLEHEIDLMVMGAFSHNRFRDFLLGSFTAKMLATTNRPLLLLR